MMRNHARGMLKVMTDDEKLGAFPSGLNIPAATVLLEAMREVHRSQDPAQRASWWMYRSSTAPPAQPDQERVASRAEHVSDALLALPALVNTISDSLNLFVLGPDDEEDKFVVLSDDEAEAEVEIVRSVVAAVEGDKESPIDVEKLSVIADLEEAVVVKK
ncbi:hypothetical protein ZWY2020_042325 [Hordeum vulgare]|nr:hypothetical protein ZWY2020_042325 [Hordeum vulgare]